MEVEAVLAIAERYLPQTSEGNGYGSAQMRKIGSSLHDSLDEEALHQAAYEVGYARGHEAGFRTGYQEGLKDKERESREQGSGNTGSEGAERQGARGQAAGEQESERAPGPRLIGLPCTHCGAYFFSDEARCPRCKTARPPRKPSELRTTGSGT